MPPVRDGAAMPTAQEVDAEVKEYTGGKPSKPIKPTRRQLSSEIIATQGNIGELKKVARRYGYGDNWAYKMKNVYSFAFK